MFHIHKRWHKPPLQKFSLQWFVNHSKFCTMHVLKTSFFTSLCSWMTKEFRNSLNFSAKKTTMYVFLRFFCVFAFWHRQVYLFLKIDRANELCLITPNLYLEAQRDRDISIFVYLQLNLRVFDIIAHLYKPANIHSYPKISSCTFQSHLESCSAMT